MNRPSKVPLALIPTGVLGLDEVLGGGLPEYSFNLIAGGPGAGKTTLAHQILFANASPQRRAVYFSVLGESSIKMLRYQQQYSFFDPDKVGDSIRFIDLSDVAIEADLGRVLERIVSEVENEQPAFVIVDSFRALARSITGDPPRDEELGGFMHRLALRLTVWQATTFLVGEYTEANVENSSVFTVADGILALSQNATRNAVVRKLQVVKIRGREPVPGMHTMRITGDGVQVFPRMVQRPKGQPKRTVSPTRLLTGVPGLDEMMGGGMLAGDSVLVAGPTGSGKTTLTAQFIIEGLKLNEPGVIVAFEEHPQDYLTHTSGLGINLEQMVQQNKLEVIYLRPLDLSVDETLYELSETVQRIGAKRVVIDSLSGFEIALAPSYREDFREAMYRMVATLAGLGVTLMMTVEVAASFNDLQFSPHVISFMADNLILQRYVELDGHLAKVISVIKMRGSAHSSDLRLYEHTPKGLLIGKALKGYRGIITGTPERITT